MAAFLFAFFFLAMLVITQLAVTYLGRAGVNILAAIMGVTDVDPFIMGMTQAAGTITPLKVAAVAVMIAAASNNLIKGIYSYSLADKKTGRQSLVTIDRSLRSGPDPVAMALEPAEEVATRAILGGKMPSRAGARPALRRRWTTVQAGEKRTTSIVSAEQLERTGKGTGSTRADSSPNQTRLQPLRQVARPTNFCHRRL